MIRLETTHMEDRMDFQGGWELHLVGHFAYLLKNRKWSLIFVAQPLVYLVEELELLGLKFNDDHIPCFNICCFRTYGMGPN